MKISWRNQQCPIEIIQQFDASRFTKNDNGGISYQCDGFLGGDIHDAASVLLSFVQMEDCSASKDELLREIVHSIMEAGLKNKLNHDFFLTSLSKRLARVENKSPQEFVIVGHLSVNSSLGVKIQKQINGTYITLGADISGFRSPISHSGDTVFKDIPSSYTPIRIKVKTRLENAALSKGGRAIGLLLGIWNHVLSYGQKKISMGRFSPVANIVLAPVRTLYNHKGEPLDRWTYDPDFVKYPTAFATPSRWAKLQENEKIVRRQLRTHRHREFLENAFVAYYTACSYHVPDNAFLSLWTLLEMLTGADKGKKVVHRALFPISQKYYERCRWELKHLNYCRNRLVHVGEGRSDIQRLIYQLKIYVDILLGWWLANFSKLNDKQEIFDLLDVPHDPKKILHRIEVLKSAHKYAKKAGR